MKVDSLELTEIKCFKEVRIEFSPGINILIGNNNSGKSTIIKALYNLQSHNLKSADIRNYAKYGRIHVVVSGISAEVNESLFERDPELQGPRSDIYEIRTILKPKNTTFEQKFFDPRVILAVWKNDTYIFKKAGNHISGMNFPKFSENEDENNFIYPFLSRRKAVGFYTETNKTTTVQVSEDLRFLTSKIQRISNVSHPDNQRYVKYCTEILGFTPGAVTEMDNNRGIAPGILTGSNKTISVSDMGEGVANIVGLLTYLFTENNKLFLIEELENDIHPKALKKLLDLIIEKSKSNQFVISTHSNIVLRYLGSLENSKIFHIEQSLEGEYKMPTSKISEIQNEPEKLMEILMNLGYEFMDFGLYEAYLILEESSSEEIINKIVIPYFVPSLSGRLRTIAAQGVDDLPSRVSDFKRLFVYIHRSEIYKDKAWVLADGDHAGKDVMKVLKRDFKSWKDDHFLNLQKEAVEFYLPGDFPDKFIKIKEIPEKKDRKDAKSALLKEFFQWFSKDISNHKNEFETSAKELIDILKNIETALDKSKK